MTPGLWQSRAEALCSSLPVPGRLSAADTLSHMLMDVCKTESCTCPAALLALGKVRGPADQQDKGG